MWHLPLIATYLYSLADYCSVRSPYLFNTDFASSPKDLEAQNSPLTQILTNATTTAPTYTRAGRGGAGNFTFPTPTSPTSADPSPDLEAQRPPSPSRIEETRAAVAASIAARQRAGGLSGRGGAGNWRDGTDAEKERQRQREEEERKEKEVELQVLKEVDVGLAEPARAYHPVGQGQGYEED